MSGPVARSSRPTPPRRDKAPAPRGSVVAGARFVAILDRTYGYALRTAPAGPPRHDRTALVQSGR
ncbi:MAG: hypothetical protein WCH83_17765, partial [Alphaproteobacteria bacterium]